METTVRVAAASAAGAGGINQWRSVLTTQQDSRSLKVGVARQLTGKKEGLLS